jgi:hypothetical protein
MMPLAHKTKTKRNFNHKRTKSRIQSFHTAISSAWYEINPSRDLGLLGENNKNTRCSGAEAVRGGK